MKLIQLTDIHLTTPGQTIGGRDPNTNFQRGMNHALFNHPDAEAIIITGDLSDWGEREDYLRLRQMLSEQRKPVHLCIGNHDDRATFLDVFPDMVDENGFIQQSIPLSVGTALLLDTWGPETHAGHFCKERADWLNARLSETDGPFWIFMHHNPIPTHIAPMDEIMLLDVDRLGAVISTHRKSIRHLFFGHCHMPLSGSFHGVPTTSGRGTNHAGWANFTETSLLSGADLPQAYTVIIATETSVTAHMVEYGYSGPIRVEGSPDYATWTKETRT